MEGVESAGDGTEGTGDSERCYSVVLVCGSDRSLCFGAVGRASRSASFCIRTDCKFKGHVVNKIKGFEGSVFFIERVPGATVYTQPSVLEEQVPRAVQAEWESKQWSLPKWVRAFQAVTIADDVMASNDDIKSEVKLLADAELFRTPSKKRKSDLGQDLSEPLISLNIVSHERALPEDGGSELDAMITGGTLGRGGLTRIVSRLEASVVEMGKTLGAIAELAHGRFIDNEVNVRLVSGAVQNLMSALGTAVEMDAKFEAPTMWGTTSFIGDEVVRLSEEIDLSKAGITKVKESVANAINAINKSETSRPEADAKMLKILTLVMNRIQEVSPELELIRGHISKLEMDLGRVSLPKRQKKTPTRVGSGGDVRMDDLMAMLSSEERGSTSSPDSHMEGEEYDHPDDEDSSKMKEELTRVAEATRLLVADVGLLKACAEDKSIKFGGLGLRTLQECNTWISTNFQGLRYGLIMDPLLMLDRIFGSDDVEAESQFKILESRVKLKITTGAEAAAIKALHFNRPRLFHKGRVAMTSERNTSKLSKLPNPKSWKSGGEGVRNYVTKQMNLIYSTVSHDITYAFGSNPKMAQAQALATMSLNATITFLTQLMGFIDTIYEKLHSHSKFSADQAWSLTTQILDRVCEDLYAPKEGVAAAMTVEDPASICSHLLWACFRTHDVMTTYMDHNFENHPAISAEYVKFLATNSGHDKVEKMEILVAAMKDNVSKALEVADKASKRADTLTDKFSAANKEVEALKKKVQALENKANK